MKQNEEDFDLILPSERSWLSRAVDDPARFYYWPVVGHLYRKRVAMCLRYCQGGEKILEVGFGSGMTFPTLGRRYQEVHGIDLHSPADRLQHLFRNKGVNCYLQNGSILELPYPDAYYDAVLLISILEHLTKDEIRCACREIRRVLRDGAIVVYGVPMERWIMRVAFRVLGYNIRKYHLSSETDVAKTMEDVFGAGNIEALNVPLFGDIYQVGRFRKLPVTQKGR